MSAISFPRLWEMPHKYTFRMNAVKGLLADEIVGDWADPFAGKFSPAFVRNDADESNEAEFHLDGLEFLQQLPDNSLDGVLFDPPYSVEQALRKYKPRQNGTAGRAEYWGKCKDEIARIVKPEGKAICFGWDSCGIGKTRGFRMTRGLLICHGACHNDTIITVERKAGREHTGNE
jgi:DNA modification methylase